MRPTLSLSEYFALLSSGGRPLVGLYGEQHVHQELLALVEFHSAAAPDSVAPSLPKPRAAAEFPHADVYHWGSFYAKSMTHVDDLGPKHGPDDPARAQPARPVGVLKRGWNFKYSAEVPAVVLALLGLKIPFELSEFRARAVQLMEDLAPALRRGVRVVLCIMPDAPSSRRSRVHNRRSSSMSEGSAASMGGVTEEVPRMSAGDPSFQSAALPTLTPQASAYDAPPLWASPPPEARPAEPVSAEDARQYFSRNLAPVKDGRTCVEAVVLHHGLWSPKLYGATGDARADAQRMGPTVWHRVGADLLKLSRRGAVEFHRERAQRARGFFAHPKLSQAHALRARYGLKVLLHELLWVFQKQAPERFEPHPLQYVLALSRAPKQHKRVAGLRELFGAICAAVESSLRDGGLTPALVFELLLAYAALKAIELRSVVQAERLAQRVAPKKRRQNVSVPEQISAIASGTLAQIQAAEPPVPADLGGAAPSGAVPGELYATAMRAIQNSIAGRFAHIAAAALHGYMTATAPEALASVRFLVTSEDSPYKFLRRSVAAFSDARALCEAGAAELARRQPAALPEAAGGAWAELRANVRDVNFRRRLEKDGLLCGFPSAVRAASGGDLRRYATPALAPPECLGIFCADAAAVAALPVLGALRSALQLFPASSGHAVPIILRVVDALPAGETIRSDKVLRSRLSAFIGSDVYYLEGGRAAVFACARAPPFSQLARTFPILARQFSQRLLPHMWRLYEASTSDAPELDAPASVPEDAAPAPSRARAELARVAAFALASLRAGATEGTLDALLHIKQEAAGVSVAPSPAPVDLVSCSARWDRRSILLGETATYGISLRSNIPPAPAGCAQVALASLAARLVIRMRLENGEQTFAFTSEPHSLDESSVSFSIPFAARPADLGFAGRRAPAGSEGPEGPPSPGGPCIITVPSIELSVSHEGEEFLRFGVPLEGGALEESILTVNPVSSALRVRFSPTPGAAVGEHTAVRLTIWNPSGDATSGGCHVDVSLLHAEHARGCCCLDAQRFWDSLPRPSEELLAPLKEEAAFAGMFERLEALRARAPLAQGGAFSCGLPLSLPLPPLPPGGEASLVVLIKAVEPCEPTLRVSIAPIAGSGRTEATRLSFSGGPRAAATVYRPQLGVGSPGLSGSGRTFASLASSSEHLPPDSAPVYRVELSSGAPLVLHSASAEARGVAVRSGVGLPWALEPGVTTALCVTQDGATCDEPRRAQASLADMLFEDFAFRPLQAAAGPAGCVRVAFSSPRQRREELAALVAPRVELARLAILSPSSLLVDLPPPAAPCRRPLEHLRVELGLDAVAVAMRPFRMRLALVPAVPFRPHLVRARAELPAEPVVAVLGEDMRPVVVSGAHAHAIELQLVPLRPGHVALPSVVLEARPLEGATWTHLCQVNGRRVFVRPE
eukprot:gnl/Chilomastix_cuspidata/1565.p2 GENE.gnl/Chilomastix_cuspidata/1565~~gnl/Chilomastix_cuspidata/1565.p2  ORF type:complete len:1423 (-),score=551.64 gnl/Chilomastix_cuspidata/1565:342-4610(-)